MKTKLRKQIFVTEQKLQLSSSLPRLHVIPRLVLWARTEDKITLVNTTWEQMFERE